MRIVKKPGRSVTMKYRIQSVCDLLKQTVGLAYNIRIHNIMLGSMKQHDDDGTIDQFHTRNIVVVLKCKFRVDVTGRLIHG